MHVGNLCNLAFSEVLSNLQISFRHFDCNHFHLGNPLITPVRLLDGNIHNTIQ